MKNRYFVFYREGGQIVQACDIPHDADPENFALMPDVSYVEIEDVSILSSIHEWKVDPETKHLEPRDRAEIAKAHESHQWQAFNHATGEFVDSMTLEDMIAEVHGAIGRERVVRSTTGIQLESPAAAFDCDTTAQMNINGKLREIEARRALGSEITEPSQLVWRDQGNVTHQFSSQAQLEAFLNELVAAIAQRNTAMYQWSWDAKDAAGAAKSREDLLQIAGRLGLPLT